jgi:hypothetical protein
MGSRLTAKPTVASPKDTVPLENLLTEVKEALAVAQQLAKEKNLPALESVTLTLQTVAVKGLGGTVRLFIFKLGATTTTTGTSKIVLTLTPPGPSEEKALGPVESNLVNAMLAASEAVKAARGSLSGFEAKQVVCEYSFGVKEEGSGTVGLTLELVPISVEVGGDVSKQAIQTVTVSFKRP